MKSNSVQNQIAQAHQHLLLMRASHMGQELLKFPLRRPTQMINILIQQLAFGRPAQHFLLIAQIANAYQLSSVPPVQMAII